MKRIFFVIMIAMFSMAAMSQSRSALKKLFDKGDFVEAKAMAGKLLKRYPKNSEYAYWYAVSCIETADTVDVRPMLEFAASRKITGAHRYLGDYYYGKEDYPAAIECYDEFLEKTKDDSLRILYARKVQRAADIKRMVMNTARICVVDSFTVPKDKFLSAYRLGSDVGTVTSNALYFDDSSLPGYLNETERGMDIYFSDYGEYNDSLMKLYHNSKVADEWGTPVQLSGFDTHGNDDYPFMSTDGVTLYFASDGEGSIGGYDIFVTRFDTESGRFLRPDNLGMPFNSVANDYMYVVDEVSNLGWFATDRNQPDGFVCVYVFIPNAGREKYDSGLLGFEGVLPFAKLSSVAATQGNEEELRKARMQLTMLHYSDTDKGKKGDFLFVVDDTRDYTRLSDFKSAEARRLFAELQRRRKQNEADILLLEQQRDRYSSANAALKKRMTSEILDLEEKVEAEYAALERMEYEVRRIEQEELYR